MTTKTLKNKYETERIVPRVPVQIAEGQKIRLSLDRRNILIKKVIKDFCPLYTPGGRMIYVGDTQLKWDYYDAAALTSLGVTIEEHGKMPDVWETEVWVADAPTHLIHFNGRRFLGPYEN